MSAVVLQRVDPSRNMRRFYRLDVQPDLFGFWLLIREWGRIGRRGQTRFMSFATLPEAQEALLQQRRAKERRGYTVNEGVLSAEPSENAQCRAISLSSLSGFSEIPARSRSEYFPRTG
ncbi:MAG: WGR domain-containing protein [Planctomycetes bacterium]|nr:WGR domain-containing protein [Planctomycetota bacterium]